MTTSCLNLRIYAFYELGRYASSMSETTLSKDSDRYIPRLCRSEVNRMRMTACLSNASMSSLLILEVAKRKRPFFEFFRFDAKLTGELMVGHRKNW